MIKPQEKLPVIVEASLELEQTVINSLSIYNYAGVADKKINERYNKIVKIE